MLLDVSCATSGRLHAYYMRWFRPAYTYILYALLDETHNLIRWATWLDVLLRPITRAPWALLHALLYFAQQAIIICYTHTHTHTHTHTCMYKNTCVGVFCVCVCVCVWVCVCVCVCVGIPWSWRRPWCVHRTTDAAPCWTPSPLVCFTSVWGLKLLVFSTSLFCTFKCLYQLVDAWHGVSGLGGLVV